MDSEKSNNGIDTDNLKRLRDLQEETLQHLIMIREYEIESEDDCDQIITQLSAVSKELNSKILKIISN